MRFRNTDDVFSGARLLTVLLIPAGVYCRAPSAQVASTPAQSPPQGKVAPSQTPAGRAARSTLATESRFSPEAFLANIALLASDKLEGRGTATRGGDLAAGYIAGRFAAAGLLPGGDEQTYFQDFEVKLGTELSNDGKFVLSGVDVTPQRGTDFLPFAFTTNEAFAGEVVFVGYGQVNADKNYDDYRDVDAHGKVVLMLRKEPPSWKENEQPSQRATFRDKIGVAKNHGAVAVLIVNQREENNGEDRLMRFASMGGSGVYGLPAFQVTRALADRCLAAGESPALDELQTRLDERGENDSAALAGVQIEGQAGTATRKGLTRNVIGVLPARGDKADEYVVLGAHYDHLGKVVAGSMSPTGARGADESELVIHNGADDNASGVSGVIELAGALAHTPGLRRNIIFMCFSGEELGLLGSRHYVDHPTVPLERIVAMINLDMIGRLREKTERIPVYGSKSAPQFEAIVSQVGAAEGFGSEGMAGSMARSDHASFDRKGIPSLFFFTETHADYHRPTDDTDKINAPGGARIEQMVYDVALQVINADGRPEYHKVEGRADADRPRGNAVMGIMPGYAEDEKPGMLVDDVIADGPAATAGLKAGDRILKIEDKPVANVYDYMSALQGRKPGDVVQVNVRRGDEDATYPVKLGGRAGGG